MEWLVGHCVSPLCVHHGQRLGPGEGIVGPRERNTSAVASLGVPVLRDLGVHG